MAQYAYQLVHGSYFEKIYRTKQIESHGGKTLVSEGVDANYMDMINYALFGLIKLEFGEE